MAIAGPMAVKNETIFAFVNIKHIGLLKILHIFFPLKSLQSQDITTPGVVIYFATCLSIFIVITYGQSLSPVLVIQSPRNKSRGEQRKRRYQTKRYQEASQAH